MRKPLRRHGSGSGNFSHGSVLSATYGQSTFFATMPLGAVQITLRRDGTSQAEASEARHATGLAHQHSKHLLTTRPIVL